MVCLNAHLYPLSLISRLQLSDYEDEYDLSLGTNEEHIFTVDTYKFKRPRLAIRSFAQPLHTEH